MPRLLDSDFPGPRALSGVRVDRGGRDAPAGTRDAVDVDDAGIRAEVAALRADGEFVPFAVGYVEFPGCLRVEGRLTENDPARLRIGMPMRVVAARHAGVASVCVRSRTRSD